MYSISVSPSVLVEPLRDIGDHHFPVFHSDTAAADGIVAVEVPVGVADHIAIQLLFHRQNLIGSGLCVPRRYRLMTGAEIPLAADNSLAVQSSCVR